MLSITAARRRVVALLLLIGAVPAAIGFSCGATLAAMLEAALAGVELVLVLVGCVTASLPLPNVTRSRTAEKPIALMVFCFIAQLVTGAFFIGADRTRAAFASDPSCHTTIFVPTAEGGDCTVHAVRIMGAKLAPTRARRYLIDVAFPQATPIWVDLGPNESLLWRQAVAQDDVPAFARRFRGTIVRVASARAWHDTDASPSARLGNIAAIAFGLAALGMFIGGLALRDKTIA